MLMCFNVYLCITLMCEFCLMEHMCCNLVCRTDVGYVLFCGFLLAGYWYLSQSLPSRNQLYAKIYFPYLTTLSIGRGNYSCSSGGSITYQGREIDLFHREATQNGHIFPHRWSQKKRLKTEQHLKSIRST